MSLLNQYMENTPQDQRSTAAIAYLASIDHVASSYPAVADSILKELQDQRSHVKLIASENYSSLAVQLAMGNLLTDKYSEGYVNHRFYAGCENVDSLEQAAMDQLKDLFGCEHSYVQPHSGADANMVAFWSILVQRVENRELEKLGEKSVLGLTAEDYEKVRQLMTSQKVMGMSLNSGGHLTHGYRANISSKMMQAVTYEINPETGLLDYDQIAAQAKEEKPTILLAGYSAYPRKVNFAKMREIADSIGAVLMVDMAHFAGLVAGKVFTGDFDPVPHSHVVTSTTHKTLRGPRGGLVMCQGEFAETIDKGCPLVLGGPLPHMIAAKAVAFKEANTADFRTYAQNVVNNAQALAEGFMKRGIPVLTGGTDNHIVLLKVSDLGITGRQAETAMREAGFTANRNAIPNDANGPWYTSGIRLGTPAVTSLGMGTGEMDAIAEAITDVLKHTTANIVEKTGKPSKAKGTTDTEVQERAKGAAHSLLGQFPLYPEVATQMTPNPVG